MAKATFKGIEPVKEFDMQEAEMALKDCPEIVRQYVNLLKEDSERWKELVKVATEKLKGQKTA